MIFVQNLKKLFFLRFFFAVVVAAAEHAGVAVLCVFVYALYIECVQILVDGQRDRLADGVLRTAADGLLDELFRHAGDLAPGVPVVVQPASVQNLRIIVPGCQCRMIDAADSGRDGRGHDDARVPAPLPEASVHPRWCLFFPSQIKSAFRLKHPNLL